MNSFVTDVSGHCTHVYRGGGVAISTLYGVATRGGRRSSGRLATGDNVNISAQAVGRRVMVKLNVGHRHR